MYRFVPSVHHRMVFALQVSQIILNLGFKVEFLKILINWFIDDDSPSGNVGGTKFLFVYNMNNTSGLSTVVGSSLCHFDLYCMSNFSEENLLAAIDRVKVIKNLFLNISNQIILGWSWNSLEPSVCFLLISSGCANIRNWIVLTCRASWALRWLDRWLIRSTSVKYSIDCLTFSSWTT